MFLSEAVSQASHRKALDLSRGTLRTTPMILAHGVALCWLTGALLGAVGCSGSRGLLGTSENGDAADPDLRTDLPDAGPADPGLVDPGAGDPGGTDPGDADAADGNGQVGDALDTGTDLDRPPASVIRLVNVGGGVPGLSENETAVAMDPADPDHFVVASQHFDVKDMNTRWLGIYATFDRGRTWSRISPPGSPTRKGLTTYGADPGLSFGPDGLIFSSTQAVSGDGIFTSGTAGVFLERSADGGLSFGPRLTGYEVAAEAAAEAPEPTPC